MAVVALLAAVILGLLMYAAKTSFDNKDAEFRHATAKLVLLDRVLAHYGPEVSNARKQLRATVERKLAESEPGPKVSKQGGFAVIELVQDELRGLTPSNEGQRWIQKRALDLSSEIAETRWFLVDDLDSSMPTPFLVILVFWLALIFFCYGLFAPRNATVLTIAFLCAVSLAASVYLVLEMDNSLEGPISISLEPLRKALDHMGK
ncbi:DUF4239 domain-containing protein [Hyphomicrobium sp.]|uniref:bestrophin-like domain n=1 Tax=Hyphomicrobium sp. TaxID=82 RepID=UPI002E2F0A1B|nr:DUF4239 domain-containing protein [Hyphomicrobium sp.]HEX2841609.1 DUF4239 domain-containing protein [Hyphomicrobium sp.]